MTYFFYNNLNRFIINHNRLLVFSYHVVFIRWEANKSGSVWNLVKPTILRRRLRLYNCWQTSCSLDSVEFPHHSHLHRSLCICELLLCYPFTEYIWWFNNSWNYCNIFLRFLLLWSYTIQLHVLLLILFPM